MHRNILEFIWRWQLQTWHLIQQLHGNDQYESYPVFYILLQHHSLFKCGNSHCLTVTQCGNASLNDSYEALTDHMKSWWTAVTLYCLLNNAHMPWTYERFNQRKRDDCDGIQPRRSVRNGRTRASIYISSRVNQEMDHLSLCLCYYWSQSAPNAPGPLQTYSHYRFTGICFPLCETPLAHSQPLG